MSAPNEPKGKLTPLPGAKLPPSGIPAAPPPMPGEAEKRLASEIEELAKAEANTLAVLAHGIRATAETGEVTVALLQDIRDLLVKVVQATGMPLPARLQTAIDKGEYNPDEPDATDDDEDDDPEDGRGDVLAGP